MKRTQVYIVGGLLGVIAILAGVYFLSAEQGTPEWQQARDLLRPQVTNEELPVVQRPLSPNVYMALVLHKGDTYSFINEADVASWGVTVDEAWSQAIQNLEDASEDVELKVSQADNSEAGKYIIVETQDGYDAARILVPSIREEVRALLGDGFIGAIPTRDFLVFWTSNFPVYDQFATQVRTEFAEAGEYAVTQELFRFTGDRVEVNPNEESTE